MADAQLKIRIGADIGAAVSGVGKLNNVLRETASAADLAGLKFAGITGRAPLGDINSFRNAVNRLRTDISTGFVPAIQRVPAVVDNVSKGLRNVRPGANQAAFAMQNLGRVAQDLPFGFIGIQNNLNPLLESFQRLRKETGSNSAALKAIGSSLLGAGGIGFALSAVTAVLSIATLGWGAWTRGLGGASEAQKKAKEEAQRLKDTIKDLAVITAEAEGSVRGEIASVQALASSVADSNLSYDQRKRALEELREINKNYFGDLKLEDAATGKLAETVKEYSRAIINAAIAKEFSSEIATVAKEAIKADRELVKLRTRFNQLEKQEKIALADALRDESGQIISPSVLKLVKERVKSEKEFFAQRDKVEQLTTQQVLLEGDLNKAIAEGLKFKSLQTTESGKDVDQLKKRLTALEKIKEATQDINQLVGIEEQIFDLKVRIILRDAAKEGLSKSETDILIDSYRRQLEDVFLQQALSLEASPRVQVQNINIVPIPAKEVESAIAKAIGVDKKISALTITDLNIIIKGSAVRAEIQEKEAIIKSLQDQIKTIINQGLVDSFAGIGESIGQILAGGGVGNIAKSFLLVVANAVQSIGKAAISAGVAMLGLKKALTAILANPAGLILAGSALVALGAGLKASIENSVPKFAEGGIATGPTLGLFGEAGKEAIIPLDRLPQLIRQAGSNGTVTVNGRLTMDSRQLVANLSRAQTNFDRIN